MTRTVECDWCGRECDPTGSRWLCPGCGFKMSCCEGEPLAALDGVVFYADEVVSLDQLVAGGFDPAVEEFDDA